MPTPFPAGKTMEELKIDTSRKFVVMKPMVGAGESFPKGAIIEYFDHQSPTSRPGGHFRNDEGEVLSMYWEELAYAEEPSLWPKSMLGQMIENETKAEQPYIPRKGDVLQFKGTITNVLAANTCIIHIDELDGEYHDVLSLAKARTLPLLSRKSPRRVTKEEVNSAFGEEVEVID